MDPILWGLPVPVEQFVCAGYREAFEGSEQRMGIAGKR